MSELQYEQDLQRTANIDKIRQVQFNLNAVKRKERIRDRLDDAQELNFDNDLQGEH